MIAQGHSLHSLNFTFKSKAFWDLLKPRLSMLVAFSVAFGYGLATRGSVDWFILSILTLAAFLLSGASVGVNQIIERDFDKLMERTKSRPLPTNRLSISEALILTFEGVGLSVPAIYFFAFFKNRVATLSVQTLNAADEFIRRLHAAAHKKPAAEPAAAPAPTT